MASTSPFSYRGGLQEIVEVHRERLQVQVLLAPQVGHRKAADVIQVVRVGRAAHVLVGRIDPVAAQVGFGDILDIVSAVAVRRPAGSSGPWPCSGPAPTGPGC